MSLSSLSQSLLLTLGCRLLLFRSSCCSCRWWSLPAWAVAAAMLVAVASALPQATISPTHRRGWLHPSCSLAEVAVEVEVVVVDAAVEVEVAVAEAEVWLGGLRKPLEAGGMKPLDLVWRLRRRRLRPWKPPVMKPFWKPPVMKPLWKPPTMKPLRKPPVVKPFWKPILAWPLDLV
jgi:hypothetical protein